MEEFHLIERLFKPKTSTAYLGIGDDCAVLQPTDQFQTVCTDTMVKGTHYPEEAIDYYAIGFKLVSVNVSDTIAMGAIPRWATLAVSVEPGFEFQAFSKGLSAALTHYNIELIGGDTTRGSEVLTLTLLGETARPVKRSGAQAGDEIIITGDLGFASAGLALLQAGQALPEIYRKAYWQPEPCLMWAEVIQNFASACIDVSDGLVQDLSHILKSSGDKGATLYPKAFTELAQLQPVAELLNCKAWDWVLSGGDDYQLCFTLPVVHRKPFEKMVQSKSLSGRVLGSVNEQSGVILGTRSISAPGYQHRF